MTDRVVIIGGGPGGYEAAHVAAQLGEEVVVDSGLAAGERIAASGSFKLRDAALVTVADAAASAANSGAR